MDVTAGGSAASERSTPSDELFPGRSRLPRSIPWQVAVLEAVAGAVMVIVSLGAMAAEIGNVSVLVWSVTAGVGALQCVLIAQLVRRYPRRAGGTPQYAYRVAPTGSRVLGAISCWCYWFAWTPAIAVNL